MKVIVFGGAGLIGSAIARELRSHGHQVVTAGRSGCDLSVDFAYDHNTEVFRAAVKGADIVVNAVGILIERGANTFVKVHVQAPTALFQACALEHVARIVHISGMGVADGPGGIAGAYSASKLAAERALAACPVDYAIVRPTLVTDAASPSTRLLQWLSRMPAIALPGLLRPGSALVQPITTTDLAEAVARICEHEKALRRVIELAGPEVMSYKEMLRRYRAAGVDGTPVEGATLWLRVTGGAALWLRVTGGAALWLPVPWWLMNLTARLAAHVPQKVVSIDTLRMLRANAVSRHNEAFYWLRHMPKQAIASVEYAQPATKYVAYARDGASGNK